MLLHKAVYDNKPDAVTLLLEQLPEQQVNNRDHEGKLPLDLVPGNNAQLIKQLVKAGAIPSLTGREGISPIERAAREQNLTAFSVMLEGVTAEKAISFLPEASMSLLPMPADTSTVDPNDRVIELAKTYIKIFENMITSGSLQKCSAEEVGRCLHFVLKLSTPAFALLGLNQGALDQLRDTLEATFFKKCVKGKVSCCISAEEIHELTNPCLTPYGHIYNTADLLNWLFNYKAEDPQTRRPLSTSSEVISLSPETIMEVCNPILSQDTPPDNDLPSEEVYS